MSSTPACNDERVPRSPNRGTTPAPRSRSVSPRPMPEWTDVGNPAPPPNSPARRQRAASISVQDTATFATRVAARMEHADPFMGQWDLQAAATEVAPLGEHAPPPVEYPSIRPSLTTPPPSRSFFVAETPRRSEVVIAPRPVCATPTTWASALEAGVEAAPSKKGKKRARLAKDAGSPSPKSSSSQGTTGMLQRAPTTLRHHPYRRQLGPPPPASWAPPTRPSSFTTTRYDRVTLLPIDEDDDGRMAAITAGEDLASVMPQTPRLRPVDSGPSGNGHGGPSRYEEVPAFGMDLDLPIPHVSAPGASYGQPLESLDLNSVRFPAAYALAGRTPVVPNWQDQLPAHVLVPSTPPVAGGSRSAWAQPSPAPRHTRSWVNSSASYAHGAVTGVAQSDSRPPLMFANVTTPADDSVLGYTPANPPAAPTPLGDISNITAVGNELPRAGYVFTATPAGGFPHVTFGEPNGVLAGLQPSRIALVLDRSAGPLVVVTVYNSRFPAQYQLRPMTTAIAEVVHLATGELDPLIVPPERDEEATTDQRRSVAPCAWLVLGITQEAVQRLLEQRVWSTRSITIFAYPPPPANPLPPRYLFNVGGFAHDRAHSVLHAVVGVFGGPRVVPAILALAQSNPDFVGLHAEEIARRVISTIEVRVSALDNGNIIAAVYCDSPTRSITRWREWRDRVARLPFPSPLNSTGTVRHAANCAGCHGADHATHLCPFQDVPGWNAPAPGGRWNHTDETHIDIAAGCQGGPPPPPPPAGGRGRGPRPPPLVGGAWTTAGGLDVVDALALAAMVAPAVAAALRLQCSHPYA
ncbi:hypothetical protein C2E23DRAFT_891144 [Lenzites betulinus]|nr:hypothetical protein C2E23DRAFT_891144 [Lenzites betulinus]